MIFVSVVSCTQRLWMLLWAAWSWLVAVEMMRMELATSLSP